MNISQSFMFHWKRNIGNIIQFMWTNKCLSSFFIGLYSIRRACVRNKHDLYEAEGEYTSYDLKEEKSITFIISSIFRLSGDGRHKFYKLIIRMDIGSAWIEFFDGSVLYPISSAISVPLPAYRMQADARKTRLSLPAPITYTMYA